MKKILLRSLSILLSFLMAVYAIPAVALAEVFGTDVSDIGEISDIESDGEGDANIVVPPEDDVVVESEIITKRTSNSKTYKLSDGSHKTVIYGADIIHI